MLARRLVEAGVRFVTVMYSGAQGWDNHVRIKDAVDQGMPAFDHAFAGLIADLDQRGLLDSTLVMVTSEFGRTPKINGFAGRDHFPAAWTTVLGGGGIAGGQAIGRTTDDGMRRITWPSSQVYVARPPGSLRDVVLLRGIEPNMKWRQFCAELLACSDELGVRLVVTLGALLAETVHSRPIQVSGTATELDLEDRLRLEPATYEGPTGIVGVLHDACKNADIPSASLWAAVPHYVSLTPSPRAAVALCERLGSLIGVEVDVDELEEAARSYEEQVSEAVASDEDTSNYVEELERRVDELEEQPDLPSGDALAAELTRFLREREQDGGGEDAAREQ
jgi:proteasome assembly chaperone (PAC2) family protein